MAIACRLLIHLLTARLIISNTDDMNDVDGAAARLRAVFRLLLRRAETISGPGAPTRSEQAVLAWLDEKGEMTPGALSAVQKVRPQTMGQTLDSLDRRRWIKRTPHPRDRRQVLISLRPTGQKALAKGRSLRQAWLVSELSKLESRDQKNLMSALDILERIVQSPTQ